MLPIFAHKNFSKYFGGQFLIDFENKNFSKYFCGMRSLRSKYAILFYWIKIQAKRISVKLLHVSDVYVVLNSYLIINTSEDDFKDHFQ